MSAETAKISPAHTLFVLHELPCHTLVQAVYPEANFVGTVLLASLLDSFLEAGGQLCSATAYSGHLNLSVFACFVQDHNAAAKIICQALTKNFLSAGARMFRFDESEGILRCIWPATGDRANDSEIMLKALTATQSSCGMIAKWLPEFFGARRCAIPGNTPKKG